VIGTFLVAIPYAIYLVAGASLLPWPPLSPLAATAIGAALAVGGGGLSYLCMILFVVLGRGTAFPTDPPRAFVAWGPYRWTRNPMYVGNLILAVGIGLYLQSTTYLLYVIALSLVTHLYVTRSEEPHLRERYGRSYLDYCAHTPRWLPKPPPALAGIAATREGPQT
jgi:protein-S-isoprenylcysteine O-methyltransferase Ste14